MKNESLSKLKNNLYNILKELEKKPIEKLNNPVARGHRDGFKEGTSKLANDLLRLIEDIENE